jgi:acyl dehydratase
MKWEDVTPGLELEPWVDRAVTRTDIVRYQGASGDFDAAHHDDGHARSFGYEGVFSLGLLHAGILSSYAVRHLGVDRIRRYKVRFKAVIALGEMLTYRGKVIKRYEQDGERLADFEFSCERPDGKSVVLGEATFRFN